MSRTFGDTSFWFQYPPPERLGIPEVDSNKRSRAKQKMKDLYMNFPEVSLSARIEARQAKSTIPPRLQRSYTGRQPVIQSSLADTLCIDLNIERVLRELNATLHTSYTLENPILPSILESSISQYDDFGTLYAHLRPYWYDLSTVKYIPEASRRDLKMREDMVSNMMIFDGNVPPRRVWDLYANRVVPYWVVGKAPHAISHAWVSDKERMDVQTPINGYQWPVPMPKDTDLNLFRIELLNERAEYVWLDVLCLRQAGGKGEDLRKKEWEIDVPTIGAIYRKANMVYFYLNGLGRPFYRKPDYWQDDRCWFNRAWTLQESGTGTTHPLPTGRGRKHRKFERKVDERLMLLPRSSPQNIYTVLWQMWNRKSTKPLDKVAGLAYILSPKSIPIYDETQSEEEAWEALVEVMDEKFVTQLLFLYPGPGNGRKHWRPSWKQATKVQLPDKSFGWDAGFVRTEGTDTDWCLCACIKSGIVRGLAKASKKGIPRQGELVVKDDNEALHIFNIFADHEYPIPDGSYTFIGQGCVLPPWRDVGDWDKVTYWVVGWQRWDGKFEKKSVIQMADEDERLKLERLHVIQNNVRVFLY